MIDMISYRDGFRLNGNPATLEEIQPIYDRRRANALSIWQQYEFEKYKLISKNLTPEQYQNACRKIARDLGV
ncbi:hypothetical protein ABM011_19515 [Morganella morganii]|uniref:hypothetical protein n=1 Tax=Morganella morganii TaxID=582 RepID=UPI003EBF08F0